MTRVLVDSHEGQTWALSLSANLVSTSNFSEQLSHRYSYMGISMKDSKLAELARLIEGWPGLVSGPADELIEDCLVLVDHLGTGRKLVDVGSGGGLPGLPLKIVRPELEVTLVEADERKAAFLVQACARLGLDGVVVVGRRAEEAAHDPTLREAFDLAVARALAPMPVLAELCLPFVRVGGRLLAQKTESEDIARAGRAIQLLGGGAAQIMPAPSRARRSGTVVVVEKIGPTPDAYPRRAGLPARKPL
jgi:16S rRNA (guanine527-N7)-methyltransferase